MQTISFKKVSGANITMKKAILVAVMIPLMFGFLLWGGGSTWGGGSASIKSSTKVITPSFLNFGGSAGFNFNARPFIINPQPIHANAAGAFRWNFFDP